MGTRLKDLRYESFRNDPNSKPAYLYSLRSGKFTIRRGYVIYREDRRLGYFMDERGEAVRVGESEKIYNGMTWTELENRNDIRIINIFLKHESDRITELNTQIASHDCNIQELYRCRDEYEIVY